MSKYLGGVVSFEGSGANRLDSIHKLFLWKSGARKSQQTVFK